MASKKRHLTLEKGEKGEVEQKDVQRRKLYRGEGEKKRLKITSLKLVINC